MDSKQEEIDIDIFKGIKLRIYAAEWENFKTKQLRDTEMVEKVRKIIERQVNKDEN
jgi:hypothetical protein